MVGLLADEMNLVHCDIRFRACDVMPFFLSLLSDKFWQIDAMKAIATWLVHDTVNI